MRPEDTDILSLNNCVICNKSRSEITFVSGRNFCLPCNNFRQRQDYIKNRDKRLAAKKKTYVAHPRVKKPLPDPRHKQLIISRKLLLEQGVKECCDCSKKLPLDNFTKNKNGGGGVHSKCKECVSSYRKQFYLDHKEHELQRNNKWLLNNHEKFKKISKYFSGLRRSIKLEATPKWLTEEHLKQMLEIYKTCPEGYHVDHIIPLNGKNVRGLHVPWNLQHLSAVENIRKSNKVQ